MKNTRELFTGHRLRCTTQRVALFEALSECKSHPTAEELFSIVKPCMSSLSLATVYNTLDALCDAGLACKMPTAAGSSRYDADTTDHLHVRLQDTGEIRDVPVDLGRRLLERLPQSVIEDIEREMGLTIDGVNVQLIGRRRRDAQ